MSTYLTTDLGEHAYIAMQNEVDNCYIRGILTHYKPHGVAPGRLVSARNVEIRREHALTTGRWSSYHDKTQT